MPNPEADAPGDPLQRLPSPALQFVAHAEVLLGEPFDLGELPPGRRRVIPIIGGSVDGPLLQGTILDYGGDWQLVWDDGTAVIDTRYLLRTGDDQLVSLQTRGFRHAPAQTLARLAAGEDVDPAYYYFRVTAVLETAAERYRWVNQTVFVAVASRARAAVAYDLYALR